LQTSACVFRTFLRPKIPRHPIKEKMSANSLASSFPIAENISNLSKGRTMKPVFFPTSLAASFIAAFAFTLSAQAFSSLSEQASYYQGLYNNPSSNISISKSEMNKGETRPKAILKGVYYFGGVDTKRDLLSRNYQNLLCENGF